jgi:ATP-dependent RNA helicase RhlB
MVKFIEDKNSKPPKRHKKSKKQHQLPLSTRHAEDHADGRKTEVYQPPKKRGKAKRQKEDQQAPVLSEPTSPATKHSESSSTSSPAQTERTERTPRRRRRRRKKPAGERTAQPASESKPAREEQQEQKSPEKKTSKPQPPKQDNWKPEDFNVPPQEGKTRFQDFELDSRILHGIAEAGFEYCTPIQAAILPHALAGHDANGRAQTGTGKTAAFLIAVFNRLLQNEPPAKPDKATPGCLIIAPTRELAMQIEKEALLLGKYVPLSVVSLYGGVKIEKNVKMLKEEAADILVATPGRLLDIKARKLLHLSKVQILVIDEADRMLDMGFIPDVRRIIRSIPARNHRQTLLFSATLSPDVVRLASQWMQDAHTVEIEPDQVAVDTVEQHVYIVTNEEKYHVLYNLLTKNKPERVLVFANRRDVVASLYRKLKGHDFSCGMLSGALPQQKRERTLEAFRENKINILVATDVAGRGLHIDGVSHVINYNVPHEAEDYVHRIGRTGRAGASGVSISFACETDSFYIPAIEEYIGREIECEVPEEEWLEKPPKGRYIAPSKDEQDNRRRSGRSGQRSGRPRRKPRSNNDKRREGSKESKSDGEQKKSRSSRSRSRRRRPRRKSDNPES